MWRNHILLCAAFVVVPIEAFPQTSADGKPAVKLPIPVAAEREAAAAIRRLGGSYELDDQKHVVKVNMAYLPRNHRIRFFSVPAKTDEAVQWMPKFPRLKTLYLHKGQATDKSMRVVAKLSELEIFYVWNAHNLTDAGTKHLAKLTKLKQLFINNSPISDETLKVCGGLPKLEWLMLQGHHCTDAGVPDLTKSKSLKLLTLLGNGKLTDTIAGDLAKITSLEELNLQVIPFTDQGVNQLQTLTNLRTLALHGSRDEDEYISDAGIPGLLKMKALESLLIRYCEVADESVRKLATLPNLKYLTMVHTTIDPKTRAQILKKHPKLSMSIGTRN